MRKRDADEPTSDIETKPPSEKAAFAVWLEQRASRDEAYRLYKAMQSMPRTLSERIRNTTDVACLGILVLGCVGLLVFSIVMRLQLMGLFNPGAKASDISETVLLCLVPLVMMILAGGIVVGGSKIITRLQQSDHVTFNIIGSILGFLLPMVTVSLILLTIYFMFRITLIHHPYNSKGG